MPYSNKELAEHNLTGAHDQERDLWSVGMIILEIFLGSDIVLGLDSNAEVRKVVEESRSWLGQRLSTLLTSLLFEVKHGIVAEMLDDGIFDSNKRVGKAIEAAQRFKEKNPLLQKMKK